jgi:hypothetical protein
MKLCLFDLTRETNISKFIVEEEKKIRLPPPPFYASFYNLAIHELVLFPLLEAFIIMQEKHC